MRNLVKNLKTDFWTSEKEMTDDIENAGFEVAELEDYKVVVIDVEDDEDEAVVYELVRANNTIGIK
jgi:hypothetical protein